MSRGAFLCIIAFLSAGLGCLLCRWALWLMPPGTAAGYAVLRFDEAVPDRYIGELLSTVTDDYISESTQYVLLDDFGALREIPLDRYAESVAPFDPRNDGYAEKLRSFFVRDGGRFFFVPLADMPGGGAAGGRKAAFERRITPLFDGIPFSVGYSGRERPVLLWFVLAATAGTGTLFLWKPRLPAAVSLPVLCALAPGGPPALALGAILAGFLFLLVEPAGELLASLRRGAPGSGPRPAGRIARNLRPFRFRLIPGVLLPVLYGAGCAAGGVPLFLGIAVFAASLGLVILSLLAESVRGRARDHVRFLPVIIMKPPSPVPAFSRIVLARFLGAALAAFLPLFFPGLRPAVPPALFAGTLPAEEDYLRHAAFQAGFSWRPLEGGEGTYRRYAAGEDGLLSEVPGGEGAAPSFPPFPLKDLAALSDDPAGASGPRPPEGEGTGPLRQVPLLVALILALPALRGPVWGRNKKKKMLVYSEKRIAA